MTIMAFIDYGLIVVFFAVLAVLILVSAQPCSAEAITQAVASPLWSVRREKNDCSSTWLSA
jgi:hypothetical protein